MTDIHPGRVQGLPRLILMAEGAALLAGAGWAYAMTGHGWPMFVALLLAPDLFMLGYLAGPRIGAMAYNLGHNLVIPGALLGLLMGSGLVQALALIWLAHIGMDRMVGYGLKYAGGFSQTHLS